MKLVRHSAQFGKCKICENDQLSHCIKISSNKNVLYCRRCGSGITFPEPLLFDYEQKTHYSVKAGFDIGRVLLSAPNAYRKMIADQAKFIAENVCEDSVLIDFGCGIGCLLYVLRDEPFSSLGIEVSNDAHDFCLKNSLSVYKSLKSIPQIPAHKKIYLVLSHVLEHFKDPVAELNAIIDCIKPYGFIFTQANYDSLSRRALGGKWPAWDIQQHYYHFSLRGIEYIMNGFGYHKKSVIYHNLTPYSKKHEFLSFCSNLNPRLKDQFTVLCETQIR